MRYSFLVALCCLPYLTLTAAPRPVPLPNSRMPPSVPDQTLCSSLELWVSFIWQFNTCSIIFICKSDLKGNIWGTAMNCSGMLDSVGIIFQKWEANPALLTSWNLLMLTPIWRWEAPYRQCHGKHTKRMASDFKHLLNQLNHLKPS